jgi:hypothetical protein
MIPLRIQVVAGVLPGDFAVAGGPHDSTLSPQPLSQAAHIVAARFSSTTYDGAISRFAGFGDDVFWTDSLYLDAPNPSEACSAIMIRLGDWDPEGPNAVIWSRS